MIVLWKQGEDGDDFPVFFTGYSPAIPEQAMRPMHKALWMISKLWRTIRGKQ